MRINKNWYNATAVPPVALIAAARDTSSARVAEPQGLLALADGGGPRATVAMTPAAVAFLFYILTLTSLFLLIHSLTPHFYMKTAYRIGITRRFATREGAWGNGRAHTLPCRGAPVGSPIKSRQKNRPPKGPALAGIGFTFP